MKGQRLGLQRIGAALFGSSVLFLALVPGSVGCGGGDDCLGHGENCSAAYLEEQGKPDAECCDGEVCCALAGGSGVPTCQRSGSCE